MTSKLIDKLTKFCFHSASPTTPASHTHNTSPNGEGRDYRDTPIYSIQLSKLLSLLFGRGDYYYAIYHPILYTLPDNYNALTYPLLLFYQYPARHIATPNILRAKT